MKKTTSKLSRLERNIQSYDRKPGKKIPGEIILIICEGDQTEPNYFKSLREYLKLSTVEVQIKDRAGAPINIVDKAIEIVTNRTKDPRFRNKCSQGFESVWCVFDVENPNLNPTFSTAVKKADQNHFNLAISNPAFEYWYILHFEKTTRPFTNGQEAKQYLARLISNYHEALPVFFTLLPKTKTAIQFSKSVVENHPEGNSRFPNPSTTVHLLVEKLINMSSSGL